MHRVFMRGGSPEPKSLVHIEDEAERKHIARVLRLRLGDELELCFEDGREFIATIVSESREGMGCEIVRENLVDRELRARIDLYQGLPKQKKLDSIVQKAVECGVARIIPVEMERSVAEIKEAKASTKQQRLAEIARGAASQSKRGYVPEVEPAYPFQSILPRLASYDLVLLCDEEEARPLCALSQEIVQASTLALIIGPEGGISSKEREVLKVLAKPVSLGPRILRTETASIVILSQLAYIYSSS